MHFVLHRVLSLPLSRRAQVRRVPEHILQRHVGHDRRILGAVHLVDGALPCRELRDGGALVLGGHRHLDRHDRLENDRFRITHRLSERSLGGRSERNLVRVDGMRGAVLEHDAHAHDRAAHERSLEHRFAEALLDGGKELGWDVVAAQLRSEFHTSLAEEFFIKGLDVALHPSKLPRATALLLVRVRERRSPRRRLADGHLGCTGRALAVVLALHALDVNLEVELAHSADDGLARFVVGVHAEGGILLTKAAEGLRKVGRGAVFRDERE